MASTESTASFGYWVRRQRLALDLTQAELARQVGCATVTISKIERDERRPSRQLAQLLAAKLAISADQHQEFLAAGLGDRATDRLPLATQPARLHAPPADSRTMSSLPVPLTPFVGRQRELLLLEKRLADRACRLLTLVGPGGVGKTRLAIRLGEIACEHEELFPDGVSYVALDGIERSDGVVSAVAGTLRIAFYEQRDQAAQLLSFLAAKQLLLIFDNAEGILDATFVEKLLTSAPNVKLVVTTREALGLPHEWFFPVGGLNLVDVGEESVDTADDAVQLFLQCAQRARSDFDLDRELQHVVQICRAVEGVPLAIELAAAWLRALPCAQIAQAVEHSLDMLTSPLRNAAERHRSMRFVLDRTWEYLTDAEQRTFRQLSVFTGGFQPDAAQAVVGASLPILASLVEKSVVQLDHGGRYQMHTLLRRLASEKLAGEAEELAAVRARHSDFYMAFLSDRHLSISGPNQLAVLAEVERELVNIQAASTYAARVGRLADSRAAFDCLSRFLWLRGLYAEGKTLIAQILDAAGPDLHGNELKRVKHLLTLTLAQFAAATGAYDWALDLLSTVSASIHPEGSQGDQALYHTVAGIIAEHQGRADNALESFRTAYDIYRAQGDVRGTAGTALRLGYAAYGFRGELVTCQRLSQESLQLYRSLDDPSSTAEALDNLAWMWVIAGDVEQAEKDYAESLMLARAVGHRLVAAKAIGGLGLVAWSRGELDVALELMLDRLAKTQEIGHENQTIASLAFLCGVYAHAGRYADAISLIEDYPNLWRSPWTAQAQIGAGMFQEAISYLPQEIATNLAAHNPYGLSRCLVAWAMLLASECDLVKQQDSSAESATMTRTERSEKAANLLSFVQAYAQADLPTRLHAAQLLGQLQDRHGFALEETAPASERPQSIEQLAQEMLAVRLA
jgi:predicted ATPase/DNA-binding XRE family transcriptional regulator